MQQNSLKDYRPYFRRLMGWVSALALAYASYVGILFVFQRHLIYFPDRAPFNPQMWELREFSNLPVVTENGLHLNAWFVLPRSSDKVTLVFFPGNKGHLGYENYKIRSWVDAGYGVVLVGYRGYGNPGAPTENGLYADARATIEAYCKQTHQPKEGLVLYGQSLGTGVATQMAREYKSAAALVLQSPYTSLPDVGQRHYPLVPVKLLSWDRYDTLAKIGDVHMPLLLLHGEQDGVVPVEFGRAVFDAANEPKQALFLPGRGHNDIYDAQAQKVLLQFLQKLPTEAFIDKASVEKDE